MRNIGIIITLFGLFLAYGSTVALAGYAGDPGVASEAASKKIAQFREAIESGDKQIIADTACFPLRYAVSKGQKVLKSKNDLLKKYDQIFTPAYMQLLAEADWEPKVMGVEGVMIGNGDIWFDEEGCTITLNNLTATGQKHAR